MDALRVVDGYRPRNKGRFHTEEHAAKIWELAMVGIFGRMVELIPGAPPAAEAQVSANFDTGGTHGRDQSGEEADLTWPAMGKRYTEYYQEYNRYRTVEESMRRK